jgi:hypothetical protein
MAGAQTSRPLPAATDDDRDVAAIDRALAGDPQERCGASHAATDGT